MASSGQHINDSKIGAGTLYVVATPIGNLRDITQRAIDVLAEVDIVAAEDTRHSGQLLNTLGISTKLTPYHEHSDTNALQKLIDRLEQGQSIALISDAGTPLISDPGYKLVAQAKSLKLPVVPVPGASALTAALSVAGLPTDKFVFEGFLPAKGEARARALAGLQKETRCMVFYEAPHRIVDSLIAMQDAFGEARQAVIARELTKRFETIVHGDLASLLAAVERDANQRRGEFVVLVAGEAREVLSLKAELEARRVLAILLDDLPLKQAASLAAKITGVRKNAAYQTALELVRHS